MEAIKTYWKTVLEQIRKGESTENVLLDFKGEKVIWNEAMILGKSGFEVPQECIDYDDDNIDYSDSPPITDEDIESGKIKFVVSAQIPLEKEVSDWIKKENININEFAAKLIRNFYDGFKTLPKNAAI